MYNILIGGAAGQGIETAATILEKILKRNGYNIFTTRDYMSRIRGGHNFIQVCFGEGEISTHVNYVDGMIALTDETFEIHKKDLIDDGFVICDSNLGDSRQLELHMNDIAKKAGNLKASVSVAVGAVLKMFGIHIDSSYEVFKENVKKEFLDSTFDCAKAGYDLVSQKFTTKAPQKDSEDRILINGNQAIALGAMTAGLKFYSAYPMTPSTSIMDFIAENMQKAQIVVEQAEDEIAGINMAIGASYAGARAMTGTSGGGFCLKVEGLGLAGMLEVPLVIANIMRPGPATGLPTRTEQSDLRFVISASQGEFPRMVISLRNPEDSYYQTIRAFNLAEKYQIPVILLGDQYLADTTRVVKKFDVNKVSVVGVDLSCGCSKGDYKRYKLTDDGISPRLIPGKCENCLVLVDSDEHDEYGRITESAEVRVNMVEKRLKKLEKLKSELIEPYFYGDEKCTELIVAWGSLDGAIKETIKQLNNASNNKYGALVFGDIFPLPKKLLLEKAKTAKKIINIEQNATGQLASVILEQSGIKCTHSILKYDGRQLCATEIVARINGGDFNVSE